MAIKPIQRYGIFQPTSVDTSAAQTMRALAGVGQALSEGATAIGKPIAEREAIKEAEVDVAKAREEGTEIEMKSPLAWGGSTYNATIEKAYVDSKQLDFAAQAARIATENPTDVMAFGSLIREQAKATLSNVQPEFKAQVRRRVDLITANTSAKIYEQQVKQQQEQANALSKNNIEVATQEMLSAANSDNPESANQMFTDINQMIDDRVLNGHESIVAAQVQKKALMVDLAGAYASGGLDKTIATQGFSAASQEIQAVYDKPPEGFSLQDRDDLVDNLRSRLSEAIRLKDIEEKESEDNLITTQRRTAGTLLTGILDNTVGMPELKAAWKSSELSFEGYNQLVTIYSSRGAGSDDYETIVKINSLITDAPEEAFRLIANNVGTNLTTNTALSLNRSAQDSMEGEGVLKRSDVARARDFVIGSIQVTGLEGKYMQDQAAKQAQLLFTFDSMVMDNPDNVMQIMFDLVEAVPLIKETPEERKEALQDKFTRAINDAGEDEALLAAAKKEYVDGLGELEELTKKEKEYLRYRAYLDQLKESSKLKVEASE
jgi:hypothetical protein